MSKNTYTGFDELKEKKGIYEAKTDLKIDIVESLSVQCQKECGWEAPVITRDRIDNGVKVYMH